MDVILIPGFWLDATSWNGVLPALHAAGHTAHPLTLPGLESKDADRSGITLRTHVDAVVDVVDGFDHPVVLVGHSGGGAIAHAVADARPDRIARVIYVDSGPLPHGGVINDELPSDGADTPLPDWSVFGEEDLVDMTPEVRAAIEAVAVPEPSGVPADPQVLSDERRYGVPVTVITSTFPEAQMRDLIAQGHPYFTELASITDWEVVELPTGHWPQFTKPAELGALIAAAVR